MPDQNATAGDNAGTKTADTAADQSAGATDSSNTSADNKQTGGTGDKPKSFTQEEVNSLLAKERKTFEKKTADAEAKAKLSEDERKDAELAEARAALRERDARDTVTEQAGKAGVKNAKLFYNAYKSELEFDDKGNVTNLKDVLASAKTESPELFTATPTPSGSADGGEGNNTNTGGLTKEQIEKMSPDEIAKNMDAIDKFLASGK